MSRALESIDQLSSDRWYVVVGARARFEGWKFNSGQALLVFKDARGHSEGYDELTIDRWIKEGSIVFAPDDLSEDDVPPAAELGPRSRLSALGA